jgi:single-stranded DNA-binding protein
MRILQLTGNVGTNPEPKHGKNSDYVKFRLSSKEFNDSETWWFNVLCYGKLAATVLKNVKVGQPLIVVGKMLQPRNGDKDGTIMMLEFEWQKTATQETEEKKDDGGFDFDIEDFDSIPEIEF